MTYTLNSVATQAVGLRFNNLCFTGQRPTQVNHNGRNAMRVQMYAKGTATTTNDLTLAPFIVAGA